MGIHIPPKSSHKSLTVSPWFRLSDFLIPESTHVTRCRQTGYALITCFIPKVGRTPSKAHGLSRGIEGSPGRQSEQLAEEGRMDPG